MSRLLASIYSGARFEESFPQFEVLEVLSDSVQGLEKLIPGCIEVRGVAKRYHRVKLTHLVIDGTSQIKHSSPPDSLRMKGFRHTPDDTG